MPLPPSGGKWNATIKTRFRGAAAGISMACPWENGCRDHPLKCNGGILLGTFRDTDPVGKRAADDFNSTFGPGYSYALTGLDGQYQRAKSHGKFGALCQTERRCRPAVAIAF